MKRFLGRLLKVEQIQSINGDTYFRNLVEVNEIRFSLYFPIADLVVIQDAIKRELDRISDKPIDHTTRRLLWPEQYEADGTLKEEYKDFSRSFDRFENG